MGPEALLAVIVALAVFALLATDRFPSEMVVMGGLVALLIGGVLSPQEAFAGFANPAVIALAGLYILTSALRHTGALARPAQRLLASVHTVGAARRRMTSVTLVLSAFLNNTPIVALFMPIASDWARRHERSVHGLLMPLSYAAVLGGVCTLMGTATHLVVHGLLLENGMPGLSVFELAPIGLPVALIGLPLVWLLARRQLGASVLGTLRERAQRREYTTDLRLTEDSPLLGKTLEEADLRQLPSLFLVRITRGEQVIAPPNPGERLYPGDLLTFAGVLDSIVDLARQRGFVAEENVDHEWVLTEAVISRGSPMEGRSIREANFRGRYNAAVIAVHRKGEAIHKKLGDIVLRHGDTLLLQAAPGLARTFRDSLDFYLISEVDRAERPRHNRAWVAVAAMAGVVVASATGLLPFSSAVVAGAVIVVAAGCLSTGAVRRSVDMSVLIVIAAALGLARALDKTGVAGAIAEGVVTLSVHLGPVGLLAIVYFAGMVLTELITNTAAAALLFPVAVAVALQAGLDPRPFVLATSISASLSLATPLGYQTNMMVYGPGGYRFVEFLKMGVPIQLILAVVAIGCLSLQL